MRDSFKGQHTLADGETAVSAGCGRLGSRLLRHFAYRHDGGLLFKPLLCLRGRGLVNPAANIF